MEEAWTSKKGSFCAVGEREEHEEQRTTSASEDNAVSDRRGAQVEHKGGAMNKRHRRVGTTACRDARSDLLAARITATGKTDRRVRAEEGKGDQDAMPPGSLRSRRCHTESYDTGGLPSHRLHLESLVRVRDLCRPAESRHLACTTRQQQRVEYHGRDHIRCCCNSCPLSGSFLPQGHARRHYWSSSLISASAAGGTKPHAPQLPIASGLELICCCHSRAAVGHRSHLAKHLVERHRGIANPENGRHDGSHVDGHLPIPGLEFRRAPCRRFFVWIKQPQEAAVYLLQQ